MKKYARKLGILGGMGPEATASLYLNIIRRCQRERHAKYNSDFPSIFINSFPVPDGQMWHKFHKSEVQRGLADSVKLIEKAGADFIAVPCNSAHYFLPVMRSAVSIPILSIVEETARAIKKRGLEKVLLLATQFTSNRQIYDKSLDDHGIKLIKPRSTQQRLIEKIIIRVESGLRSSSDRTKIIKIINGIRKDLGVQGVIAGCTEIPLLIQSNDISLTLFDTIDVLAESCYLLILGKRDLEGIS
jgi:aspartate racemase